MATITSNHLHENKRSHYYKKSLNFIHSITNSQNFENYLKNKFKWTSEVFHSIDWQAIQTYMQTLTLEQKVSFVKYSHKWRPTNKKTTSNEFFKLKTQNLYYAEKLKITITNSNAMIQS